MRQFAAYTLLCFASTAVIAAELEPDIPVLRVGSKGEHVQFAQTLLNITADGDFGQKTREAVEAFQAMHGLGVDGVIGNDTWNKLRGSGPFTYVQKSGDFKRGDVTWATGYSGAPEAKNDPSKEDLKDVGPIPAGKWTIGKPFNSETTTPFALPLTPNMHDARGRDSFQIHGDKKNDPGNASTGCIILDRHIRNHIAASGESELVVISGLE